MRLNDPFRNRFLEANSCYFGGSPKIPSAPPPAKMPEPPAQVPVTVPDPPAPIPPAPTTSKLEVEQAAEDQRRQAARRKGMRQTLIAGETGGYGATDTSASGKKTLLG
jgi:hypothetical protein